MKKPKPTQTGLLKYQEIMVKFLGDSLTKEDKYSKKYHKNFNEIVDRIGDVVTLTDGLNLAKALIYNYFMDEEKSNPIIAQIDSHLDLKELEKE